MRQILTRTDFREGVLARDQHRCVICGVLGVTGGGTEQLDAHHIIERRLWTAEHEFGGYFLDNGASVCSKHHMEAEQTVLSCDDIREAAGITSVIYPEQFYDDVELDKWGNYIQPNGTRLRGDLFYDESVQKVLREGGVLSLFVPYVKYPRTYHLPWSNPSKDDKALKDTSNFDGKEVVVSVKMDGENTSMYRDYIHARSLAPLTGQDRGMTKALHAAIAADIPEGWRICCENIYAKHSIHYNNLAAYTQVFSIWNERNMCLSWDETVEWAELLGIETVPVIYRGIFDADFLKTWYTGEYEGNECEGYVVRLADSFSYQDFRKSIAKFVRAGHVTTTNHWRHQKLIPNELAV